MRYCNPPNRYQILGSAQDQCNSSVRLGRAGGVGGLTLEFAQVDQPVVSDDPGTNGDWELLACKLILRLRRVLLCSHPSGLSLPEEAWHFAGSIYSFVSNAALKVEAAQ